MPRGGARVGAGRPRKRPKSDAVQSDHPAQSAGPTDEKPLDYMLRVMRDPQSHPELRVRMAVAAAPYCHKKLGEGGKKEEKDERAKALASKFTPSTPPPKAIGKATH